MTTMNRRTLLKTASSVAGMAAASSVIGTPLIAQERSLKIGSYGGYFENSFKEFVYPVFTEATGIAVESVTQPNSTDWLVTMTQATKAGTVPADLSLYARDSMIKASRIGGLLAPLDMAAMPASANLDPYFVFEDGTGSIGVGAMSWFTAMVVNPEQVEAPASWADFWDTETFPGPRSLLKAPQYNLEFALIADGVPKDEVYEVLATDEGMDRAFAKLDEIKDDIVVWWESGAKSVQTSAL